MSDPYAICHACGLAGKDCCHTPHAIFVGVVEAVKIHKKTGLKYSAFLSYTKFDEWQYIEAFSELIPSGKTLAFIRKPDGACIFHAETGCQIFDIRPLICRVFPFWYEQDIYKQTGEITLFIEERECGLRSRMLELKTMGECCQFMGNSEDEIKAMLRTLFKHYELARKFEPVFDSLPLDKAFKEIEKQVKTLKL